MLINKIGRGNIACKKKKKVYLHLDSLVIESGRDVSRDVGVTLFVTVVLGNVVKVITTNNDSTLHLSGGDNTGKDTTLDVDFTNERTLLINVGTILGFLGGLETVTNFLEPAAVTLLEVLGVLEDTGLLLESLFSLFKLS